MSYIKKVTKDEARLAIYIQYSATASDYMQFNLSFDSQPHNSMYWFDRETAQTLHDALEEALNYGAQE
jgi:hypothetical protein